jgi:hypothetical protein
MWAIAGFYKSAFDPVSLVKDSDELLVIAYPSFNPREELSAVYQLYQQKAKDRKMPVVIFNGAVPAVWTHPRGYGEARRGAPPQRAGVAIALQAVGGPVRAAERVAALLIGELDRVRGGYYPPMFFQEIAKVRFAYEFDTRGRAGPGRPGRYMEKSNRLTRLPEGLGAHTAPEGLWLHGYLREELPAGPSACTHPFHNAPSPATMSSDSGPRHWPVSALPVRAARAPCSTPASTAAAAAAQQGHARVRSTSSSRAWRSLCGWTCGCPH